MMLYNIKCPYCSSVYEIDDSLMDKTVECTQCGCVFPVTFDVLAAHDVEQTQAASEVVENDYTERVEPVKQGGMKKCPACAEMIKQEAVKCRYCGVELSESGGVKKNFSQGYYLLLWLFFGFLGAHNFYVNCYIRGFIHLFACTLWLSAIWLLFGETWFHIQHTGVTQGLGYISYGIQFAMLLFDLAYSVKRAKSEPPMGKLASFASIFAIFALSFLIAFIFS